MSQQAQAQPTALEKRRDDVRGLLARSQKQLQMALPSHVKVEHLMRVVMTATQLTPKLLECDPFSLLRAVMQCAQLGLEPNDGRGHAYLIPFKDKVQLVVGYKGLMDLARRSGQVGAFRARAVHEGDHFAYAFGTREYIEHQKRGGEESRLTHVYAVANLKGYEEPQFDVMERWEIERIRNASQGYITALQYKREDNPWMLHFDEMAKKTIVRRLCKALPQSPELARGLEIDRSADDGEAPAFDDNVANLRLDGEQGGGTGAGRRNLSTAVRPAGSTTPARELATTAAGNQPPTATPGPEPIDAQLVDDPAASGASGTAEDDEPAPAAEKAPDPRVADFEKRIEKATTVSGIKGILGDAATADLAPADLARINQLGKDRITKAAQAATKAAEVAPPAAQAKAPAQAKAAAPATTKPADDGTPKCGAKHITGAVCGRAEHPPDEECSDTKRGIQWLREVAAKPTRTVAPNELFQQREPGED